MELKQYSLHRKYEKGKADSRVSVVEDYSIPDGKPDIFKVLWKKAEADIEEVQAEKGKIRVRGKLKLQVLYLTERSEKSADCLSMEFPFEEILYMEEAVNGDYLKIDWSLEELQLTIIHPGKLGIRAVVVLHGLLTGAETQKITWELEQQPEIFWKTEGLQITDIPFSGKETYRIKEEISLPANKPNVGRILWSDLQLQGEEIAVKEGGLSVQGEVLFLVVYEARENETEISWMEQVIPFQGTLEVSDITSEMFGLLKAEVSHREVEVHPDYDGEMRSFSLEMLLDIPLHLYENKKLTCVTDAYGTRKQLKLQREKIAGERLRTCSSCQCKIKGRKLLEEKREPSQLLSHRAQLKDVTAKMTDKGILWEAVLEVQILYEKNMGEYPLGSMTLSVPCSSLVEISDLKKQDQWKIQERMERISVRFTQDGSVEVLGSVRLDYCVMEQWEFMNLSEITEESYCEDDYKNGPGMLIHFVQPGEDLWEIAKANRCTTEELKELNEFPGEEIVPGQKLLILKQNYAGVAFDV